MLSDQPSPPRGEIITFYSYKGGTGRSMALANVACLLAERLGKSDPVLVVDWDLEAPGLHRFFPPRRSASTAENDLGLDATPGTVDLVMALSDALPPQRAPSEDAAEVALDAAFESIHLEGFFADTGVPGVSILRAGRNDDGQYSKRVGTFDWEDLFHRCPTVYRRLAERLGATFRYVLIDSRTGVTDISGICTSLLPEKLVVVFTPNRQSLTGMWDLVGRATAYRRNSDDLRPLLVYPLPSRIEASRQDLRTLWRYGDPDKGVVGYQPMFERLFTRTYGLQRCDLAPYFDDVQIQQTADYAYGEEIAVRRSADRFSIAQSYRVFADRLTEGKPPWTAEAPPHAAPLAATSPSSTAVPGTIAPVGPPATSPSPTAPPVTAAPSADTTVVPQGRRPMAFLSYASVDRDAASRIAAALQAHGIEVRWERDVSPGESFARAIEEALDHSDAVVVCWSTASVHSEWVNAEATEGLRRGVLVPVLLDDVSPPLAFRTVQSADLRRDFDRGVRDVAVAIRQAAKSTPGAAASGTIPPTAASPRTRTFAWATMAAAAAVGVLGLWMAWRLTRPAQPVPSPSPTTAVATFPAPSFVGSSTANAQSAADLLGLILTFRDQKGTRYRSLDGVVESQSPKANTAVSKGSLVELTVATATAAVPAVVGMSLDSAVAALQKAGLRLGAPGSRTVPDAKPGTIVLQSPEPGARVAAGSEVSVTVAAAPRSVRPSLPSVAK